MCAAQYHMSEKSLAFIGNASAHESRGEEASFDPSRLREGDLKEAAGGCVGRLLWGLNAPLLPARPMRTLPSIAETAGIAFRMELWRSSIGSKACPQRSGQGSCR